MLVKETAVTEREIHVAPCLECGSTEVQLQILDAGVPALNQGGGKCKKCGHTTSSAVGTQPTMDDLAAAWNAGNDIPTLIAAEEAKISGARARIAALKEKMGPVLTLLTDEEKDEDLMTAEEFFREEDRGCLTGDDGSGFWATATHRSDVGTSQTRPDWATHVLWRNR